MVTNAFRDTGMPVAEPAVFVEGTVREEDVMTLRDKEAVVERMEEPELLWMCPPPRKPPQSRHKEAMPGSGVAGAGGLRCADSSRTDGGSDAASWKRLLGGRRDAPSVQGGTPTSSTTTWRPTATPKGSPTSG